MNKATAYLGTARQASPSKSWHLPWRANLGEPKKFTQVLLLEDDIASTAFWYQREPHAPFPTLPALDIAPQPPLTEKKP
jgi:hypothetical protein